MQIWGVVAPLHKILKKKNKKKTHNYSVSCKFPLKLRLDPDKNSKNSQRI